MTYNLANSLDTPASNHGYLYHWTWISALAQATKMYHVLDCRALMDEQAPIREHRGWSTVDAAQLAPCNCCYTSTHLQTAYLVHSNHSPAECAALHLADV